MELVKNFRSPRKLHPITNRLATTLSFSRRRRSSNDVPLIGGTELKRIAPSHIFNPPPGRTTISGRLRLSVGTRGPSSEQTESEFLMQLGTRQPMQPALRIQLQPASNGCPACFFLVPASEAPHPPSPLPSEARLDLADEAADGRAATLPWLGAQASGSSDHYPEIDQADTNSVRSGVTSSACSYFTACSSPSSGSNTRDDTLSRQSTLDLSSACGGSVASALSWQPLGNAYRPLRPPRRSTLHVRALVDARGRLRCDWAPWVLTGRTFCSWSRRPPRPSNFSSTCFPRLAARSAPRRSAR